ncbi:MAG: hypothetical protein F6K28_59585, partial [Microcoleus sp. SIO2G3]|nr:hypothetical protein [Microcoleus sp. SIO2G3]
SFNLSAAVACPTAEPLKLPLVSVSELGEYISAGEPADTLEPEVRYAPDSKGVA